MFRTSVVALAVAMAVVPARAAATSLEALAFTAASPSQSCSTLQRAMGAAVFNATYGTSSKCASQQTRVFASAKKSALAACRSEMKDGGFAADHAGKSFAQFYSGACVARKASKMLSTLSQHRLRAAKACWGQRQADPKSFDSRWKSFAACVAGDAKTM